MHNLEVKCETCITEAKLTMNMQLKLEAKNWPHN